MNGDYMREGYDLMMTYLAENRIKTKHRNFVARLKRFHRKYGDDEYLDFTAESRYLELEKYFYTNVVAPETSEERASLEVLKILSNAKIKPVNNE
ncbi:MAG: hypothetical protein IJJ47_10405 [Methanosphaera sp.]|nr:hypothetical protein [Methanosphaera sp.]